MNGYVKKTSRLVPFFNIFLKGFFHIILDAIERVLFKDVDNKCIYLQNGDK